MDQQTKLSRRKLSVLFLGTATAVAVAPRSWTRPLIESVVLPAHAQTSPVVPEVADPIAAERIVMNCSQTPLANPPALIVHQKVLKSDNGSQVLGNYWEMNDSSGEPVFSNPVDAEYFKLSSDEFVRVYQPILDDTLQCEIPSEERECLNASLELSHPFGNFSEFGPDRLEIDFDLKLGAGSETVDGITAQIIGDGNRSDEWFEVSYIDTRLTPENPQGKVTLRYKLEAITDAACRQSFFDEGQKPLVSLRVEGQCAGNPAVSTSATVSTIGANCVYIKGL